MSVDRDWLVKFSGKERICHVGIFFLKTGSSSPLVHLRHGNLFFYACHFMFLISKVYENSITISLNISVFE